MLRAGSTRRSSTGIGKPRNRADADIENFRNLTGFLAFGNALPRFLDLVGREPHLHALGAGDLPPFVCALDDAEPFILRHGRHHRHEAAPHRGREVYIAAIKDFDDGSGVDHGLDNLRAVPHRARGAIPFGNHKLVAAIKNVEGGSKFATPRKRFARCRIGIDARTTGAFQRLELPRKVLLLRAHAGIADKAFRGRLFETYL
jgi:hypothetical protein